ncbi:MAG TPA: hypothetical protein VIP77_08765 [Jiangellaceae bacterium]
MSTPSSWDDDLEVLPDTTTDEAASGWGEDDESNDQRLSAERPPHWE